MAKNFRILEDQVLARPGAAQRLAALREKTLTEIGLHELRKATEVSQVELAKKLGVTQSAISQLENSGDSKVSTLRNYVEALGGTLTVTAEFDGQGTTNIVIPITAAS